MISNILLNDVTYLLALPALKAIDEKIAGQMPLTPTRSAMPYWAELSAAGMERELAERILCDDQETIVELARRISKLEGLNAQEFDTGEGPPFNELPSNIIHVGFERGVGLKYVCYLGMLRGVAKVKLTKFLKNRRIPLANKFSKQLQGIYKELC